MFNRNDFDKNKLHNAKRLANDLELKRNALKLISQSEKYGYAHQWTWLGLPIIQLPQDILITQEIIWETKPTVIIETGIAWGGSVVFNASQLALIGGGRVLAIDKVITDEVRSEIMKFGFSDRITLIEGDSTSKEVINKVKEQLKSDDKVMVFLDSNHEEAHVIQELKCYSEFVTHDQYLNVYATSIEFLPKSHINPRPWGPGMSPHSAVRKFLSMNRDFIIDTERDDKSLGSFIIEGRLLCTRDKKVL
jgi:cephalosporin hydroxylase